jgi:peptidyl-prolyl cis-trans isomerase C
MRFLVSSFLCLTSLCAQTAPPQPKPTTLPDLPDNTPVASFDDGYVMTLGELRGLLIALDNPKAGADIPAFLNQWAMYRKMAQMASEEKLDKESPVKEQLLFAQTQVMATAEMNRQSNPALSASDAQAYYEAHKAAYEHVKVYAIYIAFSNSAASQTDSDGKKILSEAEARAKAADLLAQIRKGADFKKLARENSDDDASRAKDGFFGDLKPTDAMPDTIRNAIFMLKQGETTDVLSQPNGFYLFRAEEISYRPYSEVRDQVDREYKQERFKKWMEELQNSAKATILEPKIEK